MVKKNAASLHISALLIRECDRIGNDKVLEVSKTSKEKIKRATVIKTELSHKTWHVTLFHIF